MRGLSLDELVDALIKDHSGMEQVRSRLAFARVISQHLELFEDELPIGHGWRSRLHKPTTNGRTRGKRHKRVSWLNCMVKDVGQEDWEWMETCTVQ